MLKQSIEFVTKNKTTLLIGAAGLVLAWVYLSKKDGQTLSQSIGENVANAAVNAVGGVVTGTVKSVISAVSPWNEKNIINSTVNAVGAGLSGQKDFTLGGWIYDVTH